jgi:predicted RNA-binding Zn-ribbon protein involved in translation (DUF1610 family)
MATQMVQIECDMCSYEGEITKAQSILLGKKCPNCGQENLLAIENCEKLSKECNQYKENMKNPIFEEREIRLMERYKSIAKNFPDFCVPFDDWKARQG